jgi:hypothetical protein
MYSQSVLAEYLQELREQVCGRCIEKPPGGPPCAPLGKRCGVELDLPQLIDSVHGVRSAAMDPYIESLHADVCAHCTNRNSNQCPCPLDCLLLLAVQAIETVDERRSHLAVC